MRYRALTRSISTQGIGILPALTLMVAVMTAGCSGVHGPRQEKRVVLSDERQDREIIADAQLVRVDTAPVWQLGTNGYEAGADDLLVISRTTLASDYLPANRSSRPRTNVPMEPLAYERVWITLPGDKQIGEKIQVEELSQRFLVGYDAGKPGQQQYTQPSAVQGVVQILEDKGDAMRVAMNVKVSPSRSPEWNVVGTFEIPVRAQGRIGTPAPEGRIFLPDDKRSEGAMQPTGSRPAPASDAMDDDMQSTTGVEDASSTAPAQAGIEERDASVPASTSPADGTTSRSRERDTPGRDTMPGRTRDSDNIDPNADDNLLGPQTGSDVADDFMEK